MTSFIVILKINWVTATYLFNTWLYVFAGILKLFVVIGVSSVTISIQLNLLNTAVALDRLNIRFDFNRSPHLISAKWLHLTVKYDRAI